MATAATPIVGERMTPSGPPFPLTDVTTAPWREQALTKIVEQRFLLGWLSEQPGAHISDAVRETIEGHWDAAASAAKGKSKRRAATVERVTGHLDAVDTDLLRLAPSSYLYGQLPRLLAQMATSLPAGDVRMRRLGDIVNRDDPVELTPVERDLIVATHHDVALASRREVTRLRDFKRMLFVTAVVLTVGAAGLAVFAIAEPAKLPICFSPNNNIVCATSTTAIPGVAGSGAPAGQEAAIPLPKVDEAMRSAASGWDVPLIELVGLLAAAVSAAASLRKIRGTSTPFGLPVALALLKLPTGALTAVIGLLLMRGEFVPGLSALDSSGQIVAWAILLGYSQQLLTRFVDQRAQTVLDNFSRTPAEKQQAEAAVGSGAVPAH